MENSTRIEVTAELVGYALDYAYGMAVGEPLVLGKICCGRALYSHPGNPPECCGYPHTTPTRIDGRAYCPTVELGGRACRKVVQATLGDLVAIPEELYRR